MCVSPSVNESLFDTLKSKDKSWLEHYDMKKCRTKTILPTATSFSWSNDETMNQATQSKQCADQDRIEDELATDNLYAFKFSKDIDDIILQNSVAGVYIMYPFVDVPTLTQSQLKDEKIKNNWENLMAKQLKYMLDPSYWVTVEVIGMSKTPGNKVCVLLNFGTFKYNLI